jgi:hypothetical protein
MNDRDSSGSDAMEKTLVTVKGPGVSVTREVTDEQAAAILNVILRPVSAAPRGGLGGRGSAGKEISGSLAEFFRNTAPRRNPDKILTIAHYMKTVEGKDFLPDDILARFKEVGEPPPGNFNRDFRWTKRNGWIASDVKTGQYYVTANGSAAVEGGFPEDITKATKVRLGRGAKRRSAVSQPSDA